MPSQIDQQVKKDLGLVFNANIAITSAIDIAINAIDDVVDKLAEIDVDKDIVNMEHYMKDHK